MSIAGKKGVDISASNGNVDVEKIKKAGYEFVMIRCGYGNDDTNQDDSRFENNVRKCEAAGLPWGVYLYSYALNTAEAKSEAQHVLRLLKGKKPSLPIAFDMEDADGYKSRNGMP
ncbi:MAG: GH25 family lysozyme, partial [Oscillospiraceae bacterium]|nr:GH25 family lysozyme [Oscillospiraceae bacterium]